jgi:cellulose synthase/poly-beta-1,6-N-acetylglucosamine synthase-like glycosyltransferase
MQLRQSQRAAATQPVHLDVEALSACCEGLARAWPERSAARRLTWRQAAFGLALLGALAAAAALGAEALVLSGLALLGAGVFSAGVLLRIGSAAALLARPAAPASPPEWQGQLPMYTILCPLYREAREAPRLLAALDRLDYPKHKLDVKLLLEADDAETIAAVLRCAPAHAEILVLAPCSPRTKPKALNAGLARAQGRFVTIYDAEDAPDPRQLRAALAAFQSGGADLACVQAPLLIDNAGGSWLAAQFALEYALQFLGLNALFARFGAAFPLGGTSNHFRTEALRAAGGWDPHNVTEDADVGFRLARDGWRLGVIAPPTWEEAPLRLWPWLRQRSRWIKGHLQTWLVLMRSPGALLGEMGARQMLGMQLSLGLGLVSSLAHGPLALLTVWSLAAAEAPRWALALLLAGLAAVWLAGVAAAARLRAPRLAFSALSMPLYWPLASAAALLALWSLVWTPFYWAKTAHGCRHPPKRRRLRLQWRAVDPPAALPLHPH